MKENMEKLRKVFTKKNSLRDSMIVIIIESTLWDEMSNKWLDFSEMMGVCC